MRRLPRTLASLLVLAGVAAGCASGGGDELVVLSASSLVDVTAALGAAWPDGHVLVSDAGSQVLAAQVRAGADADVLLLADPAVAGALHDEGLASEPVAVATNGLTIVVSPEASARVGDLADLARPGLRLVLADEGVPLGDYTRRALALAEEQGLLPAGGAAAVLANAVSLEDAARVVLAKVTAGEAEAAVVYATDAAAAGEAVTTLPWPPDADVTATYTVQVVTDARAGAEEFASFVGSREAAVTWQRFGFTLPDAATAG